MATETGPDLSGATAAYRALMDDTCTVSRDSGSEDDVLDPVTGVVGDNAPTAIYDGPCIIGKQGSTQPSVTSEGGVQYVPGWYEISMPVTAPEFHVGDIVVMTSSRRDPQLVGEEYRIREVIQETFLISRDLVVEHR